MKTCQLARRFNRPVRFALLNTRQTAKLAVKVLSALRKM
jgi:hypothetical protein